MHMSSRENIVPRKPRKPQCPCLPAKTSYPEKLRNRSAHVFPRKHRSTTYPENRGNRSAHVFPRKHRTPTYPENRGNRSAHVFPRKHRTQKTAETAVLMSSRENIVPRKTAKIAVRIALAQGRTP